LERIHFFFARYRKYKRFLTTSFLLWFPSSISLCHVQSTDRSWPDFAEGDLNEKGKWDTRT